MPVDARVEQPRALGGPADLEVLGAVLHEHRDVVAEAQARVEEHLRDLVRAVVELAIRDGAVGPRHHVRNVLRALLGVEPGPHLGLEGGDDRANDFAGLHRPECFVDVLEPDRA